MTILCQLAIYFTSMLVLIFTRNLALSIWDTRKTAEGCKPAQDCTLA